MTRDEFHQSLERMRVVLSQRDIDSVFNWLDKDNNGQISYTEFTEFSEEKLRNIDPFEQFEFQKQLA